MKQNGLGDKLILVGWQPYSEVPKYIAAADICLLPAYNNEIMRDIVPIKIYEYMASGKPVIATKLPGIMKEFGEGNGVIYVDKQEDVLERASELAENPEMMMQIGLKAAKYVQKYDWENITEEFEKVLQGTVGHKSRFSGKEYNSLLTMQ
jgi:glycosyltransferase involved in cell wall biosynthesis